MTGVVQPQSSHMASGRAANHTSMNLERFEMPKRDRSATVATKGEHRRQKNGHAGCRIINSRSLG